MNKKFTRREFVIAAGSVVGLFLVSRIPSADSIKTSLTSPLTKKLSAPSHVAYGSGTYGGAHVG